MSSPPVYGHERAPISWALPDGCSASNGAAGSVSPSARAGFLTGHAVVSAGTDLFLFGGACWPSGELTNASWLWFPGA